jgi:hypothetical protein
MAKPIGAAHARAANNGASAAVHEIQTDNNNFSSFAVAENSKPSKVVFKLTNKGGKGRRHLHPEDFGLNPKSNRIEKMRLLTGFPSIWVSDQKDVAPEYVRQNLRSIVFEGGYTSIDSRDATALEFMRTCSKFIDSPNHKSGSNFEFYEHNPAKIQEELLQKQKLQMDAESKAYTIDVETMKKHALFLGVSFVDEHGFPKTPEGIRYEYVLKAKNNPKAFLDTINTAAVEISYKIKKAVSEAKIDVSKDPRKVYFANGNLICTVPINKTAYEALIEFATSNMPESKDFLEKLEALS